MLSSNPNSKDLVFWINFAAHFAINRSLIDLKRLVALLVPILFCVGILTQHLAEDVLFLIQYEASVGDRVYEPFSDELLRSQRTILEQNSREGGKSSFSIVDGLYAWDIALEKVKQTYAFSTLRLQAVCYGLLFLQCLF